MLLFTKRKKLNLALQGGGAHGAFTWGVLDRLIEDGRFHGGLRTFAWSSVRPHNDGPETADRVGLFPFESETPTELIAGFDEKHLDFRISVPSHDAKVSLATWVSPHNIGGRLYLAAIMPFHIAIARNALARVARA